MRRTIGLVVMGFLLMTACKTTPPAPPPGSSTSPPKASPPPSATAMAGSLHLGEPLSAEEVALADVAKAPAIYASKAFTTRGTVTAVCQEMGCWMEIKDASTGAHIRMHGHHFFVPKTASGHQARVQATLVPQGAPKACADEAECAPKNLTQLQLDATGVELL